MNGYPDDFNELPDSITAMKAIRKNDYSEWTPRDTLIHLLKKIDAGEKIGENLLVVYEEEDEDGPATCLLCASKEMRDTLLVGMLEEAKQMVVNGDKDED